MLYTVFVAVCIVGTPVKDCQKETAKDWMVAPEQQMGLAACMIHGQEYLAQSRMLVEGTYPKVWCKVFGSPRIIG